MNKQEMKILCTFVILWSNKRSLLMLRKAESCNMLIKCKNCIITKKISIILINKVDLLECLVHLEWMIKMSIDKILLFLKNLKLLNKNLYLICGVKLVKIKQKFLQWKQNLCKLLNVLNLNQKKNQLNIIHKIVRISKNLKLIKLKQKVINQNNHVYQLKIKTKKVIKNK